MFKNGDRVSNARKGTQDLQDAVRRRLMKTSSPTLKTTYGGKKKFSPKGKEK